MTLQHASRNQTIWILLNASALMAAGAVVTVLHLLRIREPAWAGDTAYFASLALRFLVFALAFTAWWLAALRFFRPFERRDLGIWIFYVLVAEAAVMTGLVPRLHRVDVATLANAGTPELASIRQMLEWDSLAGIALGLLAFNLLLLWCWKPRATTVG